MKKKYHFSVVEEMILNPDFVAYRGGRIEVFERDSKSAFQDRELHFLVPKEVFEAFRDIWDEKEFDVLPKALWE
jgi:hypothetical protein